MARIRSIHPGIWTDEDFASVSMAARILYFGLLTEADDHGVFEWKPIGLKMRIFPADRVDVEGLLTELSGVNKISFIPETDGKLGLVRNFCKFQRPKKPTYRHLLPAESRTYVGLSDDGSPLVPHQFGTGAEKSPQMEDEGGRREEERKKDSPSKYVFESGVIKLSQKNFDQWKSAFSHLDLAAELIGLTEWAGKQEKWFPAVSGALAKRNRQVKTEAEKQQKNPFKWNGIEGVI